MVAPSKFLRMTFIKLYYVIKKSFTSRPLRCKHHKQFSILKCVENLGLHVHVASQNNLLFDIPNIYKKEEVEECHIIQS